jgi:hypothetical protein
MAGASLTKLAATKSTSFSAATSSSRLSVSVIVGNPRSTPGTLTPLLLVSSPPDSMRAVTTSPSTPVTRASIRPSSTSTGSPRSTALIEAESPTRSAVAVSPSKNSTVEPSSSVTGSSIVAVRISGPGRSWSTASGFVVVSSTSWTRSMRCLRLSGVPWLALSRATDIPAFASASIVSESSDAGPSVHTIFAQRVTVPPSCVSIRSCPYPDPSLCSPKKVVRTGCG